MTAWSIETGELWHFTAPHLLEGILKDGIALGVTPVKENGKLRFLGAQQWLTSNMFFDQEWCANSTLPYDRTAIRLQVKIPEDRRSSLLDYKGWRALLRGRMLPDFTACKSAKSWFVFQGIIEPEWIVDIKRKPCLCDCPHGECHHDWSGPPVDIKNGFSVTCAHCGLAAIDHDVRCW